MLIVEQPSAHVQQALRSVVERRVSSRADEARHVATKSSAGQRDAVVGRVAAAQQLVVGRPVGAVVGSVLADESAKGTPPPVNKTLEEIEAKEAAARTGGWVFFSTTAVRVAATMSGG